MAKNDKNDKKEGKQEKEGANAFELAKMEKPILSDAFADYPEEVRQALAESLGDNLEGVIPRLPLIRILHQATQKFQMPGEDEIVTDFEGVIVDQVPANAMWIKSYAESGGGARPDCSSLDGRIGRTADELDVEIECVTCPHNQWGSGEDGRGKACKNMKRIAILLEGHMLPYRLTVPPTSITNMDTYLTILLDQRKPYCGVVTKFFLERATSADGIEYSQLQCGIARIASPDVLMEVGTMRKEWREQIRGQEMETEEYISEEQQDTTAPATDDAPPPSSEDTPF